MQPKRAWVIMCLVAALAARTAVAQPALPLPTLNAPGPALDALNGPESEPEPAKSFLGLASPPEVEEPTGAVVTSIPIDVPAGRLGTTPNLQVLYSSNQGNGLFGLGWRLPIGCIKRTTRAGVPFEYQNGPQDPFRYPVPGDGLPGQGDYTLEFAGNRIRLDRYLGQDGAYHAFGSSAEELFLRVWFDFAANRWIVTNKAGVRYVYGGGDDATRLGFDVFTPAGTFAWGLTSIEDPNGNRIDYSYAGFGFDSPANRYLYPQRVEWGANATAGDPHLFAVELAYEDRSDQPSGYLGGYESILAKRVVQFAVSFEGQTIRTYDFIYDNEPMTGVSRLVRVASTAFSTTGEPTEIELPATTFTYANPPHGFTNEASLPAPSGTYPLLRTFNGDNALQEDLLDVDADGLPDVVGTLPQEGKLEIWRNRGNDLAPEIVRTVPPDFNNRYYFIRSVEYAHFDMNGDFLPDALSSDCVPQEPCYWKVLLDVANAGGAVDWFSPYVEPDPLLALLIDFYTYGVRTLDLNGDRRPDRLFCFVASTSGEDCVTFLNTGSGFAADPVNWPYPFGEHNIPKRRWYDMNDDGLTDLVWSAPGEPYWPVYLNTGRGLSDTPEYWTFPGLEEAPVIRDGSTDPCTPNAYAHRKLWDMNGDGLPDYVDSSSNPWKVYMNTGRGFAGPFAWHGSGAFAGAPGNWIEWWIGSEWGDTGCYHHDTLTDLADMNGDGVADWVYARQWNQWKVKYGEYRPAGKLVRLQNTLGARYEIAYEAATALRTRGTFCQDGPSGGKPCTSDQDCEGASCVAGRDTPDYLPFPTHVVTRIDTHTGFSGKGNHLVRTYAYGGGAYDPEEAEFRGFHWIVQEDEERGRRTETEYVQAEDPYDAADRAAVRALKGKPRRQRIVAVATGQVLAERVWDWEQVSLADGRTQVHLASKTDTAFGTGGTTSQQATHTFEYDAYNNTTIVRRLAGGVLVSATAASYQYDEERHMVDRPALVNTTAPSSRRFTYDGRGNVTEIADWLDTTGEWLGTAMEYDARGQPVRVTDPRGFSTTVSWGCSHGLYPCTITDHLGHSQAAVYDLRWGKPTEVTDPNGARTTYTHDALGRVRTITRSPEIDPEPWRKFEYTFGIALFAILPSRVDTFVRAPASPTGYRQMSTFFDSIGRQLESKREDVVAGKSTVVVTDAVRFDDAGRVARRAAAFKSTQPVTRYQSPGSHHATWFEYDALDRVVKTTSPGRAYKTADFSVAGRVLRRDENATAYDDGERFGVSGHGRRTEEFHDALGRLREIKEYDGALDASGLRSWTTYTYDSADRLVSVTTYGDYGDPLTVTYTYDSLGQRTTVEDPNSGTWRSGYDRAGNLVYQDDPQPGQHLELCYDELNRLKCKYGFSNDTWSGPITCSSSASCPGTGGVLRAEYAYDACSHGAGRLCRVDDLAGYTTFVYDLRGRVVRSEKQISAAGMTKTFAFQHLYTAADQLWKTTYPTSNSIERLEYGYDAAGHITSASVPGMTYMFRGQYDRFGRPIKFSYGNLTVNRWSYYSSGSDIYRLKEIKVAHGGKRLQDFRYMEYDEAGNLLDILDPDGYGYSNASARDNDWKFAYDGLGRLTQAVPPIHSQWAETGRTFQYDRLSNMTRRGNTQFVHDTSAPRHHISFSDPPGSPNYSYDANGSLTFRPDTDGEAGPDMSRDIAYDVEGHVSSVASGGLAVQYVHDYAGDLVARIVAGMPTFYFGRLFEVTGSDLTRHIYVNDRRIAQSRLTLAAGSPLLLGTASRRDEGRRLAQELEDASRVISRLTPEQLLAGSEAARAAAFLVLVLILLRFAPGRARVGLAAGRHGIFRRLRRGHVLLILAAFGLSLIPWTCLRSARATGGGHGSTGRPPAPPAPVHFIHTDHLGSTTMLTCYNEPTPGCADGEPAAYFRYDPFGVIRALGRQGEQLDPGSYLETDRLYTGQRWEAAAGMYDYRARFYDPVIAQFTAIDSAREYVNPYAYVSWNPVGFTDPTGMVLGSGALYGTPFGFASFGYYGDDNSPRWAGLAAAAGVGAIDVVNTAFWGNYQPASGALANVGPGTNAAAGQRETVSGMEGYGEAGVPGMVPEPTAGMAQQSPPNYFSPLTWVKALAHDFASIFKGVVIGGPVGVVQGLVRLGKGVLGGDPAGVGLSLLEIATAPLRYGNFGGLAWGDRAPLAGGIPTSPLDRDYQAHDTGFGRGDYHAANAALMHAAWGRSDLGPYGQLHRILSTAVFGAHNLAIDLGR